MIIISKYANFKLILFSYRKIYLQRLNAKCFFIELIILLLLFIYFENK